jgi:hypothetical protein
MNYTEIGREYKKSGTLVRGVCIRIDMKLKTKKHDFEQYKDLLKIRKPIKD